MPASKAVSRDRTRGEGGEVETVRIVGAGNEVTAGRQGGDELLKGRDDIVEGGVEVWVVELDISDDSGQWVEIEERAVTLISLGHEEIRPSGDDVAPDVVQFA